jgi:hypothetical protein
MEKRKRKSPDKNNGARAIKAYNLAASISFIIGIIFKVINEDELFQDYTICGIILCIIALKNQQQIR